MYNPTSNKEMSMVQPYIPFAAPQAAYLQRKEAILAAVSQSFDSGRYILGEDVAAFERRFAAFLGVQAVAGCASGTDAVELALRALAIGPGKAVFTVSHTAVATVAAIRRAGAVPVLVDVEPHTYTMAPSSLEETLIFVNNHHAELEPAAIIPVHLYGHPCDMDSILALARHYGCHVIEDCAQAHGARYKGRPVGTMGKAAAFSFYPTKNLGALGDAGCVATNDAALAETLVAIRQYGWRQRYISDMPGINSRLDPVQAAILSVQLQYLENDNAARRSIAAEYARHLQNGDLVLPSTAAWAEHVFHLYVVRCRRRGELAAFLQARGIGSAVHYPLPVHLQPAYRDVLTAPGGLPVTESLKNEILSLPMYPQLDNGAVARICATIQDWCNIA